MRDEWCGGQLYRFRVKDGCPSPDDGQLIVFERIPGKEQEPEILATCYASGFQECLAAMYEDGLARGKQIGFENAREEIRRALGIK